MSGRKLFIAAPLFALMGCATVPAAGGDMVVEVSKNCEARPACHETVASALAYASAQPVGLPVRIAIGPGDFNERIVVERSHLAIGGAGAGRTRLHNDLVAENAAGLHRERWGTAGSATLTIAATDVTIADMTIENDFDYLANDALPAGDPDKIGNSQALAVLLDQTSDRVLIERAALLGYQDTLFAHGGRAVVRDSLIAGNVDFIFGDGLLLIEDSELRTRRRAPNADEFESFLLAPSTRVDQPVGILVYRSRLTREAGVRDESVALARPWHPTTTFADGRYANPDAIGQAIFVDCWMDAHIHPDHWTSMAGTARDGTKTDIFTPQSSRFWEQGSSGPGARHRDIGITWKPDLPFAALRDRITAGWAEN
ncbi:pectin esterase [Croceicoccus ponticola]|uniref:Pectin esterase n=1 Tax=Croceicoccus ponticola TaxID=2217664 RepID=A0A437GZL2_9SPHN|nr:pectinesterase family protein [Croceicoccus ponticola]RVQ68806.1 pectin esterase [Croceicoccus ponticola]